MATSPTQVRNYRLHGADQANDVLELFAKYALLRPEDLIGLLHPGPATEKQRENQNRSLNRTLNLLMARGLVHRKSYLKDPLNLRSGVFAYGLSTAGVNYAKAQGFSTPTTKTIDDTSPKNLEHEIELSLFHIAAEHATLARGLKFIWQQVDVEDADALMTIIDQANNKAHYFFIEIERSPLGKYRTATFTLENGKRLIRNEPQLYRRLRNYLAFYNTDACLTRWKDFNQFRVIIVTYGKARNGETRMMNQLDYIAGVCNCKQTYRGKTVHLCNPQPFPHRMFWFTTEKLYKSDIGGEIFFTPKDHADKAYSFFSL